VTKSETEKIQAFREKSAEKIQAALEEQGTPSYEDCVKQLEEFHGPKSGAGLRNLSSGYFSKKAQ
jgi:hypothetical protein